AISMTARRRDSRQCASTGAPSGPDTVAVRFAPPSASSVPSPPSAIGTRSHVTPVSAAACAIAAATSAAVAVPLNLSGAATIRIPLASHSMDRPIVLVSNRGPVSFELDAAGTPVAKRGAGGLVSGLAPLVAGTGTVWIAAAMSDGDRAIAPQGVVEAEGFR